MKTLLPLFLGVLVCLTRPAWSQELAYDNTATNTGFALAIGDNSTIGDLVTLAGPGRTITEFSIQMSNAWGVGGAFAEASFTLYFYKVGVDNKVGPPINGSPIPLDLGSPVDIESGPQTLTWKNLKITVPETFIWAVSLDDRSTPPFPITTEYVPAFRLFNPPTRGSSDNGFFYRQIGAPGLPLNSGPTKVEGTGSNHNFSARILTEAAAPPATPIEGNLSGTLTKGTYRVVRDIALSPVDTLTIAPGVIFLFETGVKFNVQGKLIAKGSAEAPIRFLSVAQNPSPGDWAGVTLSSTPTGTIIENAEIASAINGIKVIGSLGALIRSSVIRANLDYGVFFSASPNDAIRAVDVALEDCEVFDNRNGIGVNAHTSGCQSSTASPAIRNCRIHHNGESGISLRGSSSLSGCIPSRSAVVAPDISGNDIYQNADGITSSSFRPEGIPNVAGSPRISPFVSNNLIHKNRRHGIWLTGAGSARVVNNSIIRNLETGVRHSVANDIFIQNNVLVENRRGIQAENAIPLNPSAGNIAHNLVFGNTAGNWENYSPVFGDLSTVNANGTPADSQMNISVDPRFVSPIDLHLDLESPCINAGTSVNAPATDFDGDKRGSRVDIGYDQVLGTPPNIVAQPKGGEFTIGEAINFSVEAEGSPTLRFQWFKDGAAISGATGPQHVIPAATGSDHGDYHALVTNSFDSAKSEEAVVTVVLPDHGDFNGDGHDDIVLQRTDGAVAFWMLKGTSIDEGIVAFTLPEGSSLAAIGDFDGDQKTDLVLQDASGKIVVWLMDGSKVATRLPPLNLPLDWKVAATGEFNRDGNTDLVLQHADGSIGFWLMNGTTLVRSEVPIRVPAGWEVISTGYFNDDSSTDIVLQHADGSVAFWLMDRIEITEGRVPYRLPVGWRIAGAGEFNGDYHTDLVLQHEDKSVAYWLMNGTVVESGIVPYRINGGGWRIAGPR